MNHHIEKRVKAGIQTISLRPQEKEPEHWYLDARNKEVLRTVRFFPKNISFDVVCLIYDYKVALISSKKGKFWIYCRKQRIQRFYENTL